ncbi:MAG: hypothetical protein F4201_09145 [Nitrospira sp. SB0677_bin_15]|nr:hypothetical protein [Nitrospira sp. SB0677_bin_15]MYH02133.1 hypothetical protein [Nitrospira sp. SB0675_bin_23]
MRGIPTLIAAPFVVSAGVFADPKYQGTRMPATDTVSAAELRTMSVRHQIRVHDARQLPESPTLEGMGFALVEAPIEMDFHDPKAIATRFHTYCSDLVTAATGCLAARVVQHEVRTGEATGPGGAGVYAEMAHADVSPLIENHLHVPPRRHFGLYNVWRSIDPEGEIEVMPLALCDRATVAVTDIVYADAWRLTWPKTRVVDCRLIHSNRQCWFYYPRMTPEEVLIFKQYDTRQAAANLRSTFHTAFEDRATRENAPSRRTIEARVLAVFHEEDGERAARRARFQAEVPKTRHDGTTSSWRHEDMIDWDRG